MSSDDKHIDTRWTALTLHDELNKKAPSGQFYNVAFSENVLCTKRNAYFYVFNFM